jgi:hypothetical protein
MAALIKRLMGNASGLAESNGQGGIDKKYDGLICVLDSSPYLARVSPHMGFESVQYSPVFQHR